MKTRKFLAIAALLAFCFSTCGILAAQNGLTLPAGISQITSVEGVTEYQLTNGLRVLLVPDSSQPQVTVNITYLVGSRYESYGETGMAHLLEHMMFKGTPSHPNIPDELTRHGTRPNATTSDDRTNFFETFAATDENLNWALNLESDRMVNSYIAKKDLDSEMTVVRNEFERGENSPVSVLNQRVMETAYIWHNYGHPTIGARSDIEDVPITRLQAFYHKYYQPDNAVLIIAGKIDVAKTLELVLQKFAGIPRPSRVLAPPYTQEPAQDGEREVNLQRVGGLKAVIAAYHISPAGNTDTVALNLLTDILNDPSTGRLRQRLMDTKLVTYSRAGVDALHDPGMIEFTATLSADGDLNSASAALVKIVQGIANEPVSQAELDRAQAEELERFEKSTADSSNLAMMLSEAEATGDWRLMFWERDVTEKVTLADIQRVAAKYLISSNLTLGTFTPTDNPVRAEIAGVPDFAEMFKNYKGNTAISAGEQFNPSPANIEAKTVRSAIGPIKLAMLPKKTRGGLVSVVLQVHFGDEKSLAGHNDAARLAGNLLMSGTAKHTMQQLQDALLADKTEMNISGGSSGLTVYLDSDHEHLGAALRLMAEILKEPVFPEQDFEQAKASMLQRLEQAKTDPGSIAGLALRRALSPYPKGHVSYVPTIDESIDRINHTSLDDVKKFYCDFYGVGAVEMAIVGDFDANETKNLVAELLGNWKSPVPYRRVAEIYKAVDGRTESFETPDKANAAFDGGMNLNLSTADADYPGLILGNYMFGGGFMNSRLAERIRQKEGLSYTVGSSVSASALDPVGSFSVGAICAPQNYPKVAKAFHEELVRALSGGFTENEIKTAKSGYLQSRQVARADDDSLAWGLVQHLFDGQDYHWDEQFDQKVQALTSEQISTAMRRFIHPDQIVVMGAGDFAKAGVSGTAK
jgi:zinc protease